MSVNHAHMQPASCREERAACETIASMMDNLGIVAHVQDARFIAARVDEIDLEFYQEGSGE